MPGRPMIDPTKELPMKIAAVRAGFTPLSHVILEQGLDPEDTLEQAAKDLEFAREKGLKLDVDPTVKPAPGTGGGAPPQVVADDEGPTADSKAA
jgi:capsid protein